MTSEGKACEIEGKVCEIQGEACEIQEEVCEIQGVADKIEADGEGHNLVDSGSDVSTEEETRSLDLDPSAEYLSDTSSVLSFIIDGNHVDLSPWDEDENAGKYVLWRTDKQFWEHAVKYVEALDAHGNICIDTCVRAHGRKPTVNEFWNFYLSKTVPRQSWYAIWKTVNHERRGWPLQYLSKAKVLVKSISFSTALSSPDIEIEIVETYDPKYKVGESLEVFLWQLEPESPGEDFYHEGITVEEGKSALKLARNFYEQLYFTCDANDFQAFYENCLYDRLELIHYLTNPSPSQGILSDKDRGKIIAGIKHYHYIKNKLLDLSNQSNELASEENGDPLLRLELDSSYLTIQMQSDRHEVELRFLLDKTLRSLLGAIDDRTKSGEEDTSISSYDCILVMKNLKIEDLQIVYTTMSSYNSEYDVSNIRVMTDLESALRNCSPGCTVFVVSGDYSVSGLGRLCEGGSIIGIKVSNVDVTITPTDDIGDVWLLASASTETPMVLKDLSIVVDEDDKISHSYVFVSTGLFILDSVNFRKPNSLQRLDREYKTSSPFFIRKSSGAEVITKNMGPDDVVQILS